MIYFIRPIGQPGPIKIGWSGKPANRLATIMPWSPMPLEIVATCEGERSLELNLHRCFADQHSHGEWFHAHPRLTSAVEAIAAGAPAASAVDLKDIRGAFGTGRRNLPENVRRKLGYSNRVYHAVRRAEKAAGERRFEHPEIRQLLYRWVGEYVPTDHEIARLDALIADPLGETIGYAEWRRAA